MVLACLALLVVSRPPVAVSAGPRPPVPPPIGTTWYLAFSDEFAGSSLDRTKWTRCYWWDDRGCTNLANKELEWYLPGNVSVRAGHLKLTAKKRKVSNSYGSFRYTSGMVTTGRSVWKTGAEKPRFAFRYGYAEFRAKFPAGRGLWPALWLMSTSHKWPPEIDVVEVLGHRPAKLHHTVHWTGLPGKPRQSSYSWTGANSSTTFHTYAIDWRPDAIVYYVDGRKVWAYRDVRGIPHQPMYLLANLAVGGTWAGPPNARTKFPAAMLIDHVRVWTYG